MKNRLLILALSIVFHCSANAQIVMGSGGGGGHGGAPCDLLGVGIICPVPLGNACLDGLCRSAPGGSPDAYYFATTIGGVFKSGCAACSNTCSFSIDTSSCSTSTSTSTSTGTGTTIKPPMEDDGHGNPVFVDANHALDTGGGTTASGQTVPVSAVSPTITVGTASQNFAAAVNKKLNACMEMRNPGDAYDKFDCIANDTPKPADFNALWASSDPSTAGGQLNAIILVAPNNKPLTGFFTKDGARCNDLSEFMATADTYGKILDPDIVAGQQNRVSGGVQNTTDMIKIPTSAAYTALQAQLAAKGKRFPGPSDYKTCRFLAQAAMIAKCPANSNSSNVMTKSVTAGGVTRCAAAESILIHIRVVEFYKLSGQASMPTFDTVVDSSNINSVSMTKILSAKYGNACGSGGRYFNGACLNP